MKFDDISLDPDNHMEWIYDQNHPDYYSDRAKHLRDARDRAIRSAPEWMIRVAEMNDDHKRQKK